METETNYSQPWQLSASQDSSETDRSKKREWIDSSTKTFLEVIYLVPHRLEQGHAFFPHRLRPFLVLLLQAAARFIRIEASFQFEFIRKSLQEQFKIRHHYWYQLPHFQWKWWSNWEFFLKTQESKWGSSVTCPELSISSRSSMNCRKICSSSIDSRKGRSGAGRECKKASSQNVICSPCRKRRASRYPPMIWTRARRKTRATLSPIICVGFNLRLIPDTWSRSWNQRPERNFFAYGDFLWSLIMADQTSKTDQKSDQL